MTGLSSTAWVGKSYARGDGRPAGGAFNGRMFLGAGRRRAAAAEHALREWLVNEDDLYMNMAMLAVVADKGLAASAAASDRLRRGTGEAKPASWCGTPAGAAPRLERQLRVDVLAEGIPAEHVAGHPAPSRRRARYNRARRFCGEGLGLGAAVDAAPSSATSGGPRDLARASVHEGDVRRMVGHRSRPEAVGGTEQPRICAWARANTGARGELRRRHLRRHVLHRHVRGRLVRDRPAPRNRRGAGPAGDPARRTAGYGLLIDDLLGLADADRWRPEQHPGDWQAVVARDRRPVESTTCVRKWGQPTAAGRLVRSSTSTMDQGHLRVGGSPTWRPLARRAESGGA